MIGWSPTARSDIVKLAVPPESVGSPSSVLVLASKNSTEPVGVPLEPSAGLTVAENVTGSP